MDSTQSNVRRPELDGLRGLAILLVLIWHYANFIEVDKGSLGSQALALFRLSWSGVDLFFVLSGFLIGGILIDSRCSEKYWITFYVRRLCRIFPLYFAVLGIFVLLVKFTPAEFEWLTEGAMPIWSYVSFIQNVLMAEQNSFGANFMGPTWSLAVEEQFYFALPLLVRYISPTRLPWILAVLIVCAPVSRIVAFHWFSTSHILACYVLMPCRADALLIGVLCAWAVRHMPVKHTLNDNPYILYSVLTTLLIGMIFIGYQYETFFARGVMFFGLTLVAVFYGALLLAAVNSGKYLVSLLSVSLLRHLGNIAFGVYLLHLPVAGLAHAVLLNQKPRIHNLDDVAVSFLALGLTLLIAKMSWQFFERHFISLGKLYNYQSDTKKLSSLRQ
jgi:peptidoglycan/LPS O-acetylase OafA/YrhL